MDIEFIKLAFKRPLKTKNLDLTCHSPFQTLTLRHSHSQAFKPKIPLRHPN